MWWYNGRDLGIEQEIYGMKIYKVSNNGNLFDIRDYGAYVKLFNKSCNLLGMGRGNKKNTCHLKHRFTHLSFIFFNGVRAGFAGLTSHIH